MLDGLLLLFDIGRFLPGRGCISGKSLGICIRSYELDVGDATFDEVLLLGLGGLALGGLVMYRLLDIGRFLPGRGFTSGKSPSCFRVL